MTAATGPLLSAVKKRGHKDGKSTDSKGQGIQSEAMYNQSIETLVISGKQPCQRRCKCQRGQSDYQPGHSIKHQALGKYIMQLFSILGSVVKTDNRRNTLCISQIGRFINKGNVHDDAKSRHPRLSGQMEAAGNYRPWPERTWKVRLETERLHCCRLSADPPCKVRAGINIIPPCG